MVASLFQNPVLCPRQALRGVEAHASLKLQSLAGPLTTVHCVPATGIRGVGARLKLLTARRELPYTLLHNTDTIASSSYSLGVHCVPITGAAGRGGAAEAASDARGAVLHVDSTNAVRSQAALTIYITPSLALWQGAARCGGAAAAAGGMRETVLHASTQCRYYF